MLDPETEAEPDRDRRQKDNARSGKLKTANDGVHFFGGHGHPTFLPPDETVAEPQGLINAEYNQDKYEDKFESESVTELLYKGLPIGGLECRQLECPRE